MSTVCSANRLALFILSSPYLFLMASSALSSFFIFSLDMLVVAFCCLFVVCAIMSIMDICSKAPCSSKLAVRIPSRRTLLFPSFSQSSLKSSFESWYISVPESVHLSSVVCLDAFMKSLYFTSTATVFAICFPFRSLPATFSDS